MVEQAGDFVLVHRQHADRGVRAQGTSRACTQACQGRIPEFTGDSSSPYDVPTDADLRVDTSAMGREAAQGVIDYLTPRGGWVQGGAS